MRARAPSRTEPVGADGLAVGQGARRHARHARMNATPAGNPVVFSDPGVESGDATSLSLVVAHVGLDQRSYSTPGPVSTGPFAGG